MPIERPQHSSPSTDGQTKSDIKAAYNIVTDTVGGVNIRKADNKFQALFITGAVVVGAVIGAVLALVNRGWNLPWFGGALIGGFLGLVAGFFISGIMLMVFRAVRHLQGKHD